VKRQLVQAKHHLVKAMVVATDHKLPLPLCIRCRRQLEARLHCMASALPELALGWAMSVASASQPEPLLGWLACLCRKGLRDSLPPHASPKPLVFVLIFPSLLIVPNYFNCRFLRVEQNQ